MKTEELDAEKIAALAHECADIAKENILPVANMSYRPVYRRRMVEVMIEDALKKKLWRLYCISKQSLYGIYQNYKGSYRSG